MNNFDALWTKKQVAAYFQVSIRQVDRWCAARLLPFRLVGSRKRFSNEDLQAFMSRRSFGHPSHSQVQPSARMS